MFFNFGYRIQNNHFNERRFLHYNCNFAYRFNAYDFITAFMSLLS